MRRVAHLRHGQMAVRRHAIPRGRPSARASTDSTTSPSFKIDHSITCVSRLSCYKTSLHDLRSFLITRVCTLACDCQRAAVCFLSFLQWPVSMASWCGQHNYLKEHIPIHAPDNPTPMRLCHPEVPTPTAKSSVDRGSQNCNDPRPLLQRLRKSRTHCSQRMHIVMYRKVFRSQLPSVMASLGTA